MRLIAWTMLSLGVLSVGCTQLENERLYHCEGDSDCSAGWVCKPLQRERATSVCVKEGTDLGWMFADTTGLDVPDLTDSAEAETVGIDVPMETDSSSDNSTSAELVCEPDCSGRFCGPDGCGGQCEPGCIDGHMCAVADGACVTASCDLIGRTTTLSADCSMNTGVCDSSSICGNGTGNDICFQVCVPGNAECCAGGEQCTGLGGGTFPYSDTPLGVCTQL